MTRPIVKPNCDICSKQIEPNETQYILKVAPKSFVRGIWYKETRGDMCHKCHMDMCSRGFRPKYVKMIKNPVWTEGSKDEKWIEDISDPQKVLSTNPELTA